MPTMFELTTPEHLEADRQASAALFEGSHFGAPFTTTRSGWENYKSAIALGNEEQIHRALFESPYLLQYVIDTSGHHGTWVFSKQTIKNQSAGKIPGLVPDFLVVAKNSLGFTWHIIELKKPNVQFSNANGDGYSTVGHKAIAQCATYFAHFRDYIETVRVNVGVQELIQPKTVILIIGDAEVETDNQRICRSNFHGLTDLVRVASYDRILRGVKNDHPDWFVGSFEATT